MMKTQSKFYMGIDVSKEWFDISLLPVVNYQKQQMISERFDNTRSGLSLLKKWLKTKKVTFDQNSLLVIENTGVYHRLIWKFCSENNLPLYIGNATHIKWSFGITRGKNDKIDSQRLCNYAYKNAEELKPTPALDPAILELKDLLKARSRLMSQLGSTNSFLRELELSNEKATQKAIEQAHKPVIEAIKNSIKIIEKQLQQITRKNEAIEKNYELLISVPGIGQITALHLIGCTTNFQNGVNAKQLAAYAGVAPFQETSGSSIKGRNKVHKMSNKELKKLLYLCAMTSIRYYDEFRDYFDRKVQEGKHKLSVINAIQNKILLRVGAVIKNQQPYVDKHKNAA